MFGMTELTLNMERTAEATRRGDPLRVLDWSKVVALIKEHKSDEIIAGLREDWSPTCGTIYRNGEIVPHEQCPAIYLWSMWATPGIEINGEWYECMTTEREHPEWANVYWPDDAVQMLNE